MATANETEFTDFEVQMDFTEVDAWGGEGFQLVPPGDYTLTVVSVKQKTSKSENANTYAEVIFEVQDEGEQKGMKVYGNYTFTDGAKGRVKSLMVACGAQLDRFRAGEIMGATILATVIHTEGKAQIDENGNPKPTKTFANIINEMPLEEQPAAKVQAKVATPPVTRQTQQKPANGAQTRRA